MDCREADVCVASSPEQIHTPDPRRYTTSSPTSVRPCGLYDRQAGAILQLPQQQPQLPAFSCTQPTPHRGVLPSYAAAQAVGGAHVVSARRTRRTNSVPSAQRSVAPERYSTGRRWQERRNNNNNANNNRNTHVSHGDEETSYLAGRYMVDAMPSCATVCIAEASDEGATDELYNTHYHYGCMNDPAENRTMVQRRVSYCGGAGNEGSGLYSNYGNNNACPLLSPFLLSNSNNNNNNTSAGRPCRRDAMHHDSPSWWSLGRPTCLAPVDTHSGLTPHTERRTGQSTQQSHESNNHNHSNNHYHYSSGGSEDVGSALQPRAQNVCYSRLPGTKKAKLQKMAVAGEHDENSDEEATEQQDDVTQPRAQQQQQPYSTNRAMALPCGFGRLHMASSEEGSVSPGEQDSSLVRLSCLGPPTQRVVRYGEHGVREGGFAGVGRELFAHNEPELFAGPVGAAGEAMCPEDSNSVPCMMNTTHTTRRDSNTRSSSAAALDGAPRKAYPAMSRRETTLRARREELYSTCASRSPEARGETACEDTNNTGSGGAYSLHDNVAEMQPGTAAAMHEAQQASWARALRHESDWLLPPPSYAGAATIGKRSGGGQGMGCTLTDSFADDAGTSVLHPLADFATLGVRPHTVMYSNNNNTTHVYEREAMGPHTPRAAMHPRRVFRPCCSLDSPSRATANNNNNNDDDTVGDETQSSMEMDAQMAQLAVQASPTQKRLAFDDVESGEDEEEDKDSHTSGSETDRRSRASSSGYGVCLRRGGGPHRLPRSRTAEYGSVDQWLARTQPVLPHTCSSTSATRRSTLLLGPLGFACDENDEAEASERTGRNDEDDDENADEGGGGQWRRPRRRHCLASPTLREPSWLQPPSSFSSSFSASSSVIASRMQSRRALRHAGVGTNAAQNMRSGHTSTMAMLRRGRMHGSVPAGRKRGHSKTRSLTGGPPRGLELLYSRTRFLQETHAAGSATVRTQCARHMGGTCKESTLSRSGATGTSSSVVMCTSDVCAQGDAEPDTAAEGHYKRFRLERTGGQQS